MVSKPFQKNNRFYNHEQEKSRRPFLHSFPMFLMSWLQRTFHKKNNSNIDSLLPPTWPKQLQNSPNLSEISLIWIGHATFLIQIGNIAILTDPIFGNASFLFRRAVPPGIPLKELGGIDYILLSHNHRDHMDAASLLALRHKNPTVLVPQGDKQWFINHSFSSETVHEAQWWQSFSFTLPSEKSISFTFLTAYHWSQRGLFDRNRSLWGSWLLEYEGYRIYFAGDTAHWHHFGAIATRFAPIDIALLPIGPCEPRRWMQRSHINAQEAGEAFLALQARHFIPMHWGTFHFGLDSVTTPIEYLHTWWRQQEQVLSTKSLHIPQPGKQLLFSVQEKMGLQEKSTAVFQTVD